MYTDNHRAYLSGNISNNKMINDYKILFDLKLVFKIRLLYSVDPDNLKVIV